MSALGHKQTSSYPAPLSATHLKADMLGTRRECAATAREYWLAITPARRFRGGSLNGFAVTAPNIVRLRDRVFVVPCAEIECFMGAHSIGAA